jgi:hypothetical protein
MRYECQVLFMKLSRVLLLVWFAKLLCDNVPGICLKVFHDATRTPECYTTQGLSLWGSTGSPLRAGVVNDNS